MSNDTWDWFKKSDCSFICKKCSLNQQVSAKDSPSQNHVCSKVEEGSQFRSEAPGTAETSHLTDESTSASTSASQHFDQLTGVQLQTF
jgi:hypothetical protein